MINNLRELIYPEIDDAANVFYSKITSIILELYKEHYQLKNYFGVYDSLTFNYHFQFGSFTGRTKLKREAFDKSKVGQYVYAVWKFPYKDFREDTSEGTQSTGGKPVPVYKQTISCDLTFLELTYSNKLQKKPVEVYGVKGDTKDKDYLCLSCILGMVLGVKDLYADINAYYNTLDLGSLCEKNRYDSKERTNITQSNKYERDCGRVFKCTRMNNRSREVAKWWYYSVDSKGIYWLLDTSEFDEPDLGTPQFSDMFNADLVQRGSTITTVSYKEGDLDIIEVRIGYRGLNIFNDAKVSSKLDVYFEPNSLDMFNRELLTNENHWKNFVSRLIYAHHSIPTLVNSSLPNDCFEYALVLLMFACPIMRTLDYKNFKPYGKDSTKKLQNITKMFEGNEFSFSRVCYVDYEVPWTFNEFFMWSMWLLGLNPRSYGGSTGSISSKYRVASRTYLNKLSGSHYQTQDEFDYYAVTMCSDLGSESLLNLSEVSYEMIPSTHVFETSGNTESTKAVKLNNKAGYISEAKNSDGTPKFIPYTSNGVQVTPVVSSEFHLGEFSGKLPYSVRRSFYVSEATETLHDSLYATYNMVKEAVNEFSIKTNIMDSIFPYFVSGVTATQNTVKFSCKDKSNALVCMWSY